MSSITQSVLSTQYEATLQQKGAVKDCPTLILEARQVMIIKDKIIVKLNKETGHYSITSIKRTFNKPTKKEKRGYQEILDLEDLSDTKQEDRPGVTEIDTCRQPGEIISLACDEGNDENNECQIQVHETEM